MERRLNDSMVETTLKNVKNKTSKWVCRDEKIERGQRIEAAQIQQDYHESSGQRAYWDN